MVAMLRLLLFARILSLTNYAKIGPVGVNLIQLMKDSLLGVHVVVKTINLDICPRRVLAQRPKPEEAL